MKSNAGPSMADLMHRRRSSRMSNADKFQREGGWIREIAQDSKDIDYEIGGESLSEREYPMWWSSNLFFSQLRILPENIYWNIFVCMSVQASVVWAIIDYWDLFLDIAYNTFYGVHVIAICYNTIKQRTGISFWVIAAFFVDLISFSHFANPTTVFRLMCYYVRLHRPFTYLFAVADFNLKGSVWGTTAKYSYVFMVLRITWALIWINLDKNFSAAERTLPELRLDFTRLDSGDHHEGTFLSSLYLVNKMFIPIGPSVPPKNDLERIVCLIIMLSGTLVVTGIAIASLSLVIALYMRPEETFRARYRLIIRDMTNNHIPVSKIERVKTFYRMFWKNQKAVSETALLPSFPPTLPTTIYMDIFFEATQKTKILKDLSYPFLSELAKYIETIHYIPGDAIIKRGCERDAVIYITYGEIEMVTPEDDMTGILRFSKGTVLTPCGVATMGGLGTAHLEVRAVTFCTAHVLRSKKLWQIAVKYGKNDESTAMILDGFYDHIEKVKQHYQEKNEDKQKKIKYKSSIQQFKRCLVALKEAKNSDGTLLMENTEYFMHIAGAYVLRNYATLTDESDEICLRSSFPCILQPTSSLIFAWNLIVACVVFTVCMVYPYYLVYQSQVPVEFRFFNYMVSAVYCLDLLVHLSTGDNVEQGVAITFAQTSSQQMMNLWFVVDVLATMPIFQFIGSGYFSGINKLLKAPKAFRMLRELEYIFVYRSHVVRFLSYTLLLATACYFIASLQQGIMCYQFDYCVVSNFTHRPHWANKPMENERVAHRLLFGFYWAISMVVFSCHKETWRSDDWQYILSTMMILEICIVLRVFMESVYSATIMVTTFLRDDFQSTISNVKSFLERNQVDTMLQHRFLKYLKLCWYTDKAYSVSNKKKSIYFDLPSHVYHNILVQKRNKFLLDIPFFKYITEEDMKDITSRARLFYTSPNEILQNTGDITNEFYIVRQGYLEMICPVTGSYRILKSKSRFGLLICLFRIPAYYTVRALTHVQMFAISRKHLLPVMQKQNIMEAMEYVRAQPDFERCVQRYAPFLAYERPAQPPNLVHFELPRKHEPDHAFLMPFFRLGFFSILRYIFPRFTIRPDSKYIVFYECLHAVSAFLTAILTPALGYMNLQYPWLYYFSLVLDLLTYFDIFQRMLIGYFNEHGLLIYHPASTAANYMKGAFITDVFACLPLEYLEPPVKEGDKFRVTKLKQILSLNRLVQLYRVPGAMMFLDQFIERQDVLVVIKAIPLFVVLLNTMTCFVVLNSVNILHKNGKWWILPFNDDGGSWVVLFKDAFRFNITETPFNIQLATFFWMSFEVTSTGYNTFNPSNFDIMYILLVGLLIGTMMITYFSVVIISIRSNVNKALAEFQENLKDMVVYMKREKLSAELQQEVLTHYEYAWDKMGGVDYRQVFKLCDHITLRTDVILHIYGPTFANCPILLQSDASLLRTLGRAVHSEYFSRGPIIIKAEDVIEDLYFVDYGDVTITETTAEQSFRFKLSRGSIFGNLDGQPSIRCPLTVTSSSKIHLLMINSQAFHTIIADFPTVTQLMKKFRPTPTANFILGLSADPFRRKERQSTPMVVTKNKGLVKFLFFEDKYVQNYFIMVSMACIYADMYNAGFQVNSPLMIAILYALDVAFLLKIVLKLSLPLLVGFDMKNMLNQVRREYLKLEFKLDVASCVPIELLAFFVEKEYTWVFFSWLRVNRLIRITTVHKSLYRHEERITVNLTIMTIFSVFIWFTLFVHGVSCLWFFIGTLEDLHLPGSSWMWKDNGESWCSNEYLCSLYFVLTTFTQNGVGDVMPKKHAEVFYVIVLQVISTMVYMIYVGEFSNIIQYQSFRCFSFYTKYLELQDYLLNNRVSHNLKDLVNRYCVHLWRESRGMQEPVFLMQAPHAMRLEIMSAAYLHHLQRHHVFEQCEPAFLRQLAGCLKLYNYNEGMYVVKSNEITDSMYLIHRGRVRELLMSGNEINQITRVYPAGSYFGVMQGLSANTPYARTYQTVSNAQVLTLSRSDWIYLTHHFPKSRDEIQKHMRSDISRIGKGSVAGSIVWHSPIMPKQKQNTQVTEIQDAEAQASHAATTVSQINAMLEKDSMINPPLLVRLDKSVVQPPKTQEGSIFKWPSKRQDSDAVDFTPVTTDDGQQLYPDKENNLDQEKKEIDDEYETSIIDFINEPQTDSKTILEEQKDKAGPSKVPRKSVRLYYDDSDDEKPDDETPKPEPKKK